MQDSKKIYDLSTRIAIDSYFKGLSSTQLVKLAENIYYHYDSYLDKGNVNASLPNFDVNLQYDKETLATIYSIASFILDNLRLNNVSYGVLSGISDFKRLSATIPLKVKVKEYNKGLSKSSEYYFVEEGDSVYHISRYANVKEGGGEAITYWIPFDVIKNKTIIEVLSSNSGLFDSVNVFSGEEFAKYNNFFLFFKNSSRKPLSYLNRFNFAWLSRQEINFMKSDWKKYYVPMLAEISNLVNKWAVIYAKQIGFSTPYYGLPNLLDATIKGNASYPVAYLIPYSKKARDYSLQGLTKEIHQIWIVLKILEARAHQLNELRLDFKQSSSVPIFVYGNYSVWHEFDLYPHTMCDGELWYNKVQWVQGIYEKVERCVEGGQSIPLRPDIAILRNARSCKDLEKGLKVDVIIEAKNLEFSVWEKNIDTQILPYKCIFDPKLMIVASLHSVPQIVKQYLNKQGIYLIENVYPGGNGMEQILKMIP
ncbi:hypothetical protein GFS03_04070 [Sulfolobus sp. E5-1-F]|uniref:hypothetical protein n=1 Tax=Saccharolobus sp. E5-1-F TaxID=2663019 RepID=UPI001296EF58|nr:hypothetical protein [Sulfolobus sp. E5-1-F]QGA53816.1 hypothetical protein GFS03_04070 [Sulfolobus sp. E5-1-F]